MGHGARLRTCPFKSQIQIHPSAPSSLPSGGCVACPTLFTYKSEMRTCFSKASGFFALAAGFATSCSANTESRETEPSRQAEPASAESSQGEPSEAGSSQEGSSPPSGAEANNGESPAPNAPASSAPGSENPGVLVVSEPPPAPAATTAGEAACASASSESQLAPVTLLIALDRSTSMNLRFETRWAPITEALKSFFVDDDSLGLSATLQLFPPRSRAGSCATDRFAEPHVGVTPLPADVFAPVIELNSPPQGDTPTLPAMRGLLAQAQAIRATETNTNVAIVLVTDGIPSGCRSTVASVSEVAATALAEQIPTYTIGVGRDLDSLNGIAEAGGTREAVLIDDTDPQATQTILQQRLTEIGNAAASCEIVIPDPPEGRVFEPLKVTTEIQSPGGAPAVPVDYSPDCRDGSGWRYDDLDNPTEISLCEDTCQTLRSARNDLTVVFGCAVNSQIVK